METLLGKLYNELKLLCFQVETWNDLFVHEQEKRSALLEKTAPGFFSAVGLSLAESILMRLCRLMDPPKTGDYENASLQNLISKLPPNIASPDAQLLIDHWKAGNYQKLRDMRNKSLGHNDFKKMSDEKISELWSLDPEVFPLAMELAKRIWDIYRSIHKHFYNKDIIYPGQEYLNQRPIRILTAISDKLCLDKLAEDKDTIDERRGDYYKLRKDQQIESVGCTKPRPPF